MTVWHFQIIFGTVFCIRRPNKDIKLCDIKKITNALKIYNFGDFYLNNH